MWKECFAQSYMGVDAQQKPCEMCIKKYSARSLVYMPAINIHDVCGLFLFNLNYKVMTKNQQFYATKKYGCVWYGRVEGMDPEYEYIYSLTSYHRTEKGAIRQAEKLAKSHRGN